MPNNIIALIVFVFVALIIILICLLYNYCDNPFNRYSVKVYTLDISGKKSKERNDYIDYLIMRNPAIADECVKRYNEYMEYIKLCRQDYAKNKHRLEQIDERWKEAKMMIQVDVYRNQIRYQQVDYV